eukprot:TRINITY_DN2034_c0_g1_i1.p1 TRINITY_DN2034_c0_g1~~TRINITY_DN2034_c0_g1_i1.p1  ORF type:complete len:979 (-),score=187.89 TRINITY_DN2034_c0_g1_i1:64-2946(-)
MSEPIAQPNKSPSDTTRNYKQIVLTNQLQVLLISEPETDKAAAALDVCVGSFADPKDYDGLAHFCEHMLFLGTEKYPQENSYAHFLSQHAGSSNASTSSENTNYHFTIEKAYLKPILDIFAQFFISPLFTPSCTEREVNAVHSEHEKNLQLDARRQIQISKACANPESPFSKFTTGNMSTLNKPEIRDKLIEFHNNNYSANIMKLCILGAEPLETLEEWAREMFSAIPNKNLEIPGTVEKPLVPPFLDADLRKYVYSVPVKATQKIKLLFPVQPATESFYKSKPNRYLSHLIGHESDGSIFYLLKEKLWATSLSAGLSMSYRDFEIFGITIALTPEGFEHIEEVIAIVFEYIGMVKKEGVKKHLWDEISQASNIEWRFKSKSGPYNYCKSVANCMQHYSPSDVLSGPYLLEEFREDQITDYLKFLTPENLIVDVIAKEVEEKCTLTEKWYGAKYNTKSFDSEYIQKWRECLESPKGDLLHLPKENIFMPTKLDIKPFTEKTEEEKKSNVEDVPKRILSTPTVDLWHLQDRTYNQPKAHFTMSMVSPLFASSPHHEVMGRLFVLLLEDQLNEITYYADVAGLEYSCNSTYRGFLLSVHGFDEKLPVLVETIVQNIMNLKIDSGRLELNRRWLQDSLTNFYKNQPYDHAAHFLHSCTVTPYWSTEEKLAALQDVTKEALEHFKGLVLERLFLNVFYHGNVLEQEAIDLVNRVEAIIKPKSLLKSEITTKRVVKLESGKEYILSEVEPNVDNENSAITQWYQVGLVDDIVLDVQLSILSDLLKDRCFHQLRTQQQLGYIVWSGKREVHSVTGYKVTVQSPVKDPAYIDDRIEEFLKNSLEWLKTELTDEEYQNFVSARIVKYSEKIPSLARLHDEYWPEISNFSYKFDFHIKSAEIAKTVKKEDVIGFFEKYVLNPETRKKFSSRVYGNKHPLEEVPVKENTQTIKLGDNFVRRASLWPTTLE